MVSTWQIFTIILLIQFRCSWLEDGLELLLPPSSDAESQPRLGTAAAHSVLLPAPGFFPSLSHKCCPLVRSAGKRNPCTAAAAVPSSARLPVQLLPTARGMSSSGASPAPRSARDSSSAGGMGVRSPLLNPPRLRPHPGTAYTTLGSSFFDQEPSQFSYAGKEATKLSRQYAEYYSQVHYFSFGE